MDINIKIDNKGCAEGTIGWLAKNAAMIKIGETKNRNQGAWLQDHQGKTLTILAIRDYWGMPEDPRIEKIKPNVSPPELECDFTATDAAWVVLEKLTNLAEAEMNKGEQAEDAQMFSVVKEVATT